MSPRARWLAKRSKRAYFRSKYACSGYRLIKLQQQDPDSFYIGIVGANWSGRVQALKAIENYLKRATELKVGPYYKPNAKIKLLESGTLRMPNMPKRDEHKLSLLRRCDMIVHVVRCFELHAPPGRNETEGVRDGDRGEIGGPGGDAEPPAPRRSLDPWEEGVFDPDAIDWPVPATPLQDVQRTVADMALADLHFIEERSRKNHTRYFWRNRNRALNEQKALRLVQPALEDRYAVGSALGPMGHDFDKSCLRDERAENGTTIRKNRMRESIAEIGFLSSKPVVYVANLPAGEADPVVRVARAHAETVLDIERRHGVPAVAACLVAQDGQEAVGAKVFRAMPRGFLAQDPKQKKAAKSIARGKRGKLLREGGRRVEDRELAGRTLATPATTAGVGGEQEEPVGVSAEPPQVVA